MTTTPQIPSHLRFMIAGIQDRALDLALLGTHSVKAEMDITEAYAMFELVTRADHCEYGAPATTRINIDLKRLLGMEGSETFSEAMTEAREGLAAMLDHLNTLIEQELPA